MKFHWFGTQKEEPVLKANNPSAPEGDVAIVEAQQNGVFKAYIPGFLYKPPYGYPRPENLPLIRQTARNPYVYAIIKTICDEVASAEWDICLKEDVDMTPELEQKQKDIINFFSNPNGNKESLASIFRAVTKDILEIDSGVIVKVFNEVGELVQIYARDGGSFLKNPDIYGYMGDKVDIIEPASTLEGLDHEAQINYYDLNYKQQAAYFQYGWTSASMPIPWGKNEIVYMMQNPRSDSIYGLSPVAILSDVIYTLVYGSQYNLDFYQNNNMPEGIFSVLGANNNELKAAKERFEGTFRTKDETTGFWRRIAFRMPWTNHDVKFTPFQMDPKTMQVLEQQQWFTKVVWAAFGVTPDEMGFTENSNKAVSETQHAIAQRKAGRPIFKILQYHINQEIMPEFDTDKFEFKFVEYNLDEELKKYDLYMKKQQVGVATPEMIADEEGIDSAKIKEAQEEKEAKEAAEFDRQMQAQKDIKAETKALLIKEVPDDIDDGDEFEAGMKVKVIAGSKAYLDKVGTIEKMADSNSIIVRFDVGVDIFSAKQLVPIGDDSSELAEIKAKKDPFNSTELEKKMLRDIDIAGKKVKKALARWKT